MMFFIGFVLVLFAVGITIISTEKTDYQYISAMLRTSKHRFTDTTYSDGAHKVVVNDIALTFDKDGIFTDATKDV